MKSILLIKKNLEECQNFLCIKNYYLMSIYSGKLYNYEVFYSFNMMLNTKDIKTLY